VDRNDNSYRRLQFSGAQDAAFLGSVFEELGVPVVGELSSDD
jgi:hypothetical protein